MSAITTDWVPIYTNCGLQKIKAWPETQQQQNTHDNINGLDSGAQLFMASSPLSAPTARAGASIDNQKRKEKKLFPLNTLFFSSMQKLYKQSTQQLGRAITRHEKSFFVASFSATLAMYYVCEVKKV